MHITEVTKPYTVHVEVTADEWAATVNRNRDTINRDLRLHNIDPVIDCREEGTATLCVNVDALDRDHAMVRALDVVEGLVRG